MAHLEKRTEEDAAYHCLLAAAEKYALSLFYSANNPQVCSAFSAAYFQASVSDDSTADQTCITVACALQRHGMCLTANKVKQFYVFTAYTDMMSTLCTDGLH